MNAFPVALKIFVAHEDLPSGIRAVSLLNKLSASLENYLGLGDSAWQMEDNNFWNFGSLLDLDLREQVLAACIEADIIVISAGGQTQLPASVKTWIESALGRKEGRPSAVVAIFSGRQEPSTNSLLPIAYLRQLAERHGVDFFSNLDNQPQPGDSAIEAVFYPRFESDAEFSHDASANEFENKRWGIND